MRIVILILALSTSILGCGLHLSKPLDDHSSRAARAIIGGANVTTPGKWPWQVLVVSDAKYGTSVCGGTIIGEEWVLTAAHCLDFANITKVDVYVGLTQISQAKHSYAHKVIDTKIHPDYGMPRNDIAILKLETPLAFNELVSSICLPNSTQSIPDDGRAVATGYGRTYSTNRTTRDGQFREVLIPIIPPEVCEERWSHKEPGYENETLTIWKKMNVVCAGSLAHGVSKGDSGGPLTMKASNGKWFQIGIASLGNCMTEKCEHISGEKLPYVFTDIRKYCNWIKESTEGKVACQEEEIVLEDVGISV